MVYGQEFRKSRLVPPGMERKQRLALDRSESSAFDSYAALEARNRELSAFAHTVAHDLKDPLSIILATSEAIFRITDLTAEELQAYLYQIQTSAHTMDDMIDNLLLLGELADTSVPLGPVDMGTLFSHVEMRLGFLIRKHHAQVIHPAHWPVAVGYGPWIEEVWSNLISNALKYGGRPPRIEVGAQARPDGSVLFWVDDNGPGVSAEARAHLFQPFTRLGTVRTSGHGLGLSIIRRIVEKLGGQVGFEMAAGGGSRFYFTLPASA